MATGTRVTSQVSVSLLDRSVSLPLCGANAAKGVVELKRDHGFPQHSSPRKCAWLAKAHAVLYLFDPHERRSSRNAKRDPATRRKKGHEWGTRVARGQ